MGTYLSKANTTKDSDDGGDPRANATRYGVSAMQGWRQNMEDAHVTIPQVKAVENLLKDHRLGLYGVFDGHGGPTVSQWIANHVEKTLEQSVEQVLEECKRNEPIEDKSNLPLSVRVLCEALQRTFLQLDVEMQSDVNREEIREIFEAKKKAEDTESEDSSGQYQSLLKLSNRTLLQAILRGPGSKPQIKVVEQDGEQYFQVSAGDEEDEEVEDDEDEAGTSGFSAVEVDAPTGMTVEEVVEGEEKKPSAVVPLSPAEEREKKEEDAAAAAEEKTEGKLQKPKKAIGEPERSDTPRSPRVGKKGLVGIDVEIRHIDSTAASTSESSENEATSASPRSRSPHRELADPAVVAKGIPETRSTAPVVEILAEGEADADLRESGASSSVMEGPAGGILTRSALPAWGPENCGAAAIVGAVVETPEGPFLITANAGDSRCVLCRNGQSVGMSQDHKPQLQKELQRIQKAGGSVFAGRVDGNLNLSRTLGDLYYKSNTQLGPEQQKITAFPDIRVVPITRDDEFVILACDGIWDCVTNDDAVKFVKQRLGDNPDAVALSRICEELCDHCLAGNPVDSDGGIGCDNMTCVIVMLNQNLRAKGANSPTPVALFEDAFRGGVAPTALENQETKSSSNPPNQYFDSHDEEEDDDEEVDTVRDEFL